MFKKTISPIDFAGRGKIISDGANLPVIVHGTYHPYDSIPVFCTISPVGKRKGLGGNISSSEVAATTSDGEDLRIIGLDPFATTYFIGSTTVWKGNAKYFMKGQLGNFYGGGSEIHCNLSIPYTPLAQANAYYSRANDGTIRLDERSERKGIKWNTPLGEVELIDNYEYVDDKVGDDVATIRIKRCQAHLVVKRRGRYSLEKLLRELPELFDDTFWLLSFLGRKRIVWHSAEVVAFPVKGKSEFRKAIARRQSWLGYQEKQQHEETWLDLLVKIDELRNGLFEKLNEAYKTSKYKTLISRTIPFIIMSFEQGYFESHIANTYSALETMIAGLSLDEDKDVGLLLPSGDFRRLTKKLRSVIDIEIDDESTRNGISRKLGELNRRPILDRLMTLLNLYQVPTTMLWQDGIDIKDALGQILKRRNRYIHQGRIDNLQQYYEDYSRLRTLVELWILKLLDCPEHAINNRALQLLTK